MKIKSPSGWRLEKAGFSAVFATEAEALKFVATDPYFAAAASRTGGYRIYYGPVEAWQEVDDKIITSRSQMDREAADDRRRQSRHDAATN